MQAGAQAGEDSSLKEKAMKRLHVHVAVNDIPQSVGFYSALFRLSLPSSKRTTQNGCLMIRA
jgi:predicted enzyme related to lactoylglutathione lyase